MSVSEGFDDEESELSPEEGSNSSITGDAEEDAGAEDSNLTDLATPTDTANAKPKKKKRLDINSFQLLQVV